MLLARGPFFPDQGFFSFSFSWLVSFLLDQQVSSGKPITID
jgi:hypothetical protein